jgi:hypothetical protein
LEEALEKQGTWEDEDYAMPITAYRAVNNSRSGIFMHQQHAFFLTKNCGTILKPQYLHH